MGWPEVGCGTTQHGAQVFGFIQVVVPQVVLEGVGDAVVKDKSGMNGPRVVIRTVPVVSAGLVDVVFGRLADVSNPRVRTASGSRVISASVGAPAVVLLREAGSVGYKAGFRMATADGPKRLY